MKAEYVIEANDKSGYGALHLEEQPQVACVQVFWNANAKRKVCHCSNNSHVYL